MKSFQKALILLCLVASAVSKSPVQSDVKINKRSTVIGSIRSGANPLTTDNAPKEIMAGVVTAVATIPTSIAYASIAGVSPLIGIWTSAILGFFVALFGGGRGLIAGTAGVIAQPLGKLSASHGPSFLVPTMIFSSVFQVLFGALKLGKVAALVEMPVVAGFLNAFAVYLAKSQLKVFKHAPSFPAAVFLSALCAAIIQFLPMVVNIPVPSSLVGLVVSTLVAILFDLPAKTLTELAPNSFAGGLKSLPTFSGVPSLSFLFSGSTISKVGTAVVGIVVISLVETLLASKVVALNSPEKGEPDLNKLASALGLGTFVTSLFGGIGGTGLIPNTVLNCKSGGAGSNLSALTYGTFLSLCVVLLAPIIGKVPMACLAGVMFIVSMNTFEWKETQELFTHAVLKTNMKHIMDLVAMITTFFLCLEVDMGVGVIVGVIISKLHPLLSKLIS